MHYATLVVLSTRPEDLDVAVSQAMEMGKDIHWDWYQIGGRWTGALSGYNPDEDPANLEGNGTRTKWPTQWARHPGDVVLVESLTQEQVELFAHVVCAEHGWFTGERYEPWQEGDRFPKLGLPPVEWLKKAYKDGVVVVVDCHN